MREAHVHTTKTQPRLKMPHHHQEVRFLLNLLPLYWILKGIQWLALSQWSGPAILENLTVSKTKFTYEWDIYVQLSYISLSPSPVFNPFPLFIFSFSAPPSSPHLLFSSLWHIYTQLRSERNKLISLKLLTKLRCVSNIRPNYNSIFSFSIHSCIPCCSQFTLCQQYS